MDKLEKLEEKIDKIKDFIRELIPEAKHELHCFSHPDNQSEHSCFNYCDCNANETRDKLLNMWSNI